MKTYKIICSTNSYQGSVNPLFKDHETTAIVASGLDLEQAHEELDSIAINKVSDDTHRFDDKISAVYNIIADQASAIDVKESDYIEAHQKMVDFLCSKLIEWNGPGLYMMGSLDKYIDIYTFGADSFDYDGYYWRIEEA